jgi:predicted N-acetyltransferase YhbS
MSQDIQIVYLAECPQYVQLLAKWCHEQWGYLSPNRTLKDVEANFSKLLSMSQIPFSLVVLDDKKPVAMASLELQDMDIYPELTPWLASVYVVPDYRKKGIGSKVVKTILEKAKEQHIEKIYLFTMDQEHWYNKMKFQVLQKTKYYGEDVTVMFNEIGYLGRTT